MAGVLFYLGYQLMLTQRVPNRIASGGEISGVEGAVISHIKTLKLALHIWIAPQQKQDKKISFHSPSYPGGTLYFLCKI